MMRNTLVLLASFFFISANAQHCGYDFKNIIVLDVYSESTGDVVIPNLRITIVDRKGHELDGYQFEQGMAFPFIGDSYAVIVPSNLKMEGLFLKIESTYEMNLKDRRIALHEEDKYQLCDHDDLDYFVEDFEGNVYQPIEVSLKKRK